MSLQLPYSVQVLNPIPLDYYYYNDDVPYTSTVEVNSTIDPALRYQGLTVNISGTEYWYGAGIDDVDLVEKGSEGVLAHGDLTGLTTGDDHTQYLNETRGDARYYTETEIDAFYAGTTAITGYNKTDWDEAHTWGDHAGLYSLITHDHDSDYSAIGHNHDSDYEPIIAAGTATQYWRGDKTWQTLNTTTVTEGTNLYYTDTRVSANTDVAANTAARHSQVTFGSDNQIPYTNSGTDDFDYSSNLTFDGSDLAITGDLTVSADITAATIQLTTGATNGYYLRSDASGNGTWAAVAASQTYIGTWDADTNSPSLADGTGTAGDYYRVVVAGTQDLGSGNITFSVGDDVIYNADDDWERIPAATITGNALTKTDDTNVTLTLGGSASTALVNAASITAGWTGTLADSRIASAGTWNTHVGTTSGNPHSVEWTELDGARSTITLSGFDDDLGYTTYTDGSGIGLAGSTFSVTAGEGLIQEANGLAHDDTSSQTSINSSGRTYIQDIALDDFGHVTALGTATETYTYSHPSYPGDDINIDTGSLSGVVVISDLDFNVTTDTLGHVTDANGTVATRLLNLGDFGYTGPSDPDNYNGWDLYTDSTLRGRIEAGDNVNIVGGTNVTLGYSTTNNTITINSAGSGGADIDFGNVNEIPYTNSTTNDFNYSSDLTFDGVDLKSKRRIAAEDGFYSFRGSGNASSTGVWQKVCSFTYSGFTSYSFTLKVCYNGGNPLNAVNTDVHIGYKNQLGDHQISANIVNYGVHSLPWGHFQIYRNDTTSTITIYSYLENAYQIPDYTIIGVKGPEITWYGTNLGSSLSGETNDAWLSKTITKSLDVEHNGGVTITNGLTVDEIGAFESTGTITRDITANEQAVLDIDGGNYNANIWRVYNNYAGSLGFRLQYYGSGSGDGNSLKLISDTANVYEIFQSGNITFTGILTAANFALASDPRLKDVESPVTNGLEIVESLNPVNYTWKDKRDEHSHIGFLTTDVEEVRPELVIKGEETDSLSYMQFTAINTAAIKELSAQVADLQKQLKELKDGLSS